MLENSLITPAIEDYLEMICRVYKTNDIIRVSELAKMLNVRQSSVTKMLKNLHSLGLVDYQNMDILNLLKRG